MFLVSIKPMDLDFRSLPCLTKFPLVFSFAFSILPLPGTGTVAMACASYTFTVFESLHMAIARRHPGLFLSECLSPSLVVCPWFLPLECHIPACLSWPSAFTCSSLPCLSQSHSPALPISAHLCEFHLHFSLPTVHHCTISALTLGPPACSCPAVTCSQYDKYDYQKACFPEIL